MNILFWIRTHKRITLVIIATVFLGVFLAFTIFQAMKNRLFPVKPPANQVQTSTNSKISTGSMLIKSSKTSYSLSEKILISATANSGGDAVSAFDVVIEFDPEFLSLTTKKSPTLGDFSYFGSNSGKLLQITGVQKAESKNPQVFNGTKLFEFEFTPKKTGQTTFKIVFSPNATNESNLINTASLDVLNFATGATIEIK